jgi:hypothetical protein
MTSDKYLLLTCKHTPHRRIQIGIGKHTVHQWRCACGKIVPLTKLQSEYVLMLDCLLIDREFLGTLTGEQEASMAEQLNDCRQKMTKSEEEPLNTIAQAVANSRPKTRAA